jgi:hypothetical protein
MDVITKFGWLVLMLDWQGGVRTERIEEGVHHFAFIISEAVISGVFIRH